MKILPAVRRLSSATICLLALISPLLAAAPVQAERFFPIPESERAIRALEESVAYILTLSDDELRERVPVESGGIWFTDCPNCDFGSQDRGRFEWLPEKPHQIRCQGCQAVYPDNPDYPDDQHIEVDAPHGVHRFAFWEHPETGYRIFFRAHADYLHRAYLERTIRDLGRLYAATGDRRYARPAAILLHRFAEVVPGYAYIYDFPYRQKRFSPYTQDRIPGVAAYRTSLWTRWAYNDISIFLLEGYGHLIGWDGWESVGGGAANETVEEDLFGLLVRFVFSFEDPLTNMSPRIWRGGIVAGRILGRPEWVHESIRRFERMLATQFLHDGHWYETSPSYHAMTINGMRTVMEAASGYSDPPDYRDPKTGRRFDNLNLVREVPQYGLAIRALEETRLPNGRLLPVNDTWAVHEKVEGERRGPRERSESLLMPGLGVAILGAGQGENQIFSWLNFTSGVAHKQRDTLSIGLFAGDRELLPDVGYTHTRYRRSWASSMMAHNTVVVDGMESLFDQDHSGNRIVAFASNGKNFHLAAAESEAAYPERTERYRRTLLLMGEGAEEGYLLDVFEVSGGRQHDYILHGSADEDSRAVVAGAELEPYDGTLVNPGAEHVEPAGEHDEMGEAGSFSFIRDLEKGVPQGQIQLDMRLVRNERTGSRTILAPMEDAEVFLGRSPSLRRAAESDARIDDDFMPGFVLRRAGGDLESIFVAAHEPVDGEPGLRAVHSRRDGDRLWISIAHAGGRDYVTLVVGERTAGSIKTSQGAFSTDASYAAVRLDPEGAIRSAHLVEGEGLTFGGYELQGPGSFQGELREVKGGEAGETAFPVDERMDGIEPDVFILEFADGSRRGFSVTEIEATDSGSLIHVREAAGFTIGPDSVQITSYPQRTIDGAAVRYRLTAAAHAEEGASRFGRPRPAEGY